MVADYLFGLGNCGVLVWHWALVGDQPGRERPQLLVAD
jgi:hypothetical protein